MLVPRETTEKTEARHNKSFIKRLLYIILAVECILFTYCLHLLIEEVSTVRYIKEVEYVDAETIPQKISKYADKYQVSSEVMHTVVACESNYNPLAVGDSGHSRGLVQIHRPSHPDITDDQAFDEDFALEFLAKGLSNGDGWMWTCYNIHYGYRDTKHS